MHCLPLMWDKIEVPGPPWPQVWSATSSFPGDRATWRAVDQFPAHPVCGRLAAALNVREMFRAPYPDPSLWNMHNPGVVADVFNKASPWWLERHTLDYCLQPDTAVCTSYTVC